MWLKIVNEYPKLNYLERSSKQQFWLKSILKCMVTNNEGFKLCQFNYNVIHLIIKVIFVAAYEKECMGVMEVFYPLVVAATWLHVEGRCLSSRCKRQKYQQWRVTNGQYKIAHMNSLILLVRLIIFDKPVLLRVRFSFYTNIMVAIFTSHRISLITQSIFVWTKNVFICRNR